MLWRLALAAPRSIELPWEPVRRRAIGCMQRSSDPYVELHHLLALAGAGDLDGLDRWLSDRDSGEPSRPRRLLARMAAALHAWAAGDYPRAGWELAETVPHLSEIGGSRAQNELFADIEKDCWRRV